LKAGGERGVGRLFPALQQPPNAPSDGAEDNSKSNPRKIRNLQLIRAADNRGDASAGDDAENERATEGRKSDLKIFRQHAQQSTQENAAQESHGEPRESASHDPGEDSARSSSKDLTRGRVKLHCPRLGVHAACDRANYQSAKDSSQGTGNGAVNDRRPFQPTGQARLGRLLRRGQENADGKAAALCRQLQKWWAALWTFGRVDGVEPTNNAAERALRPAVLWRKGSFGSDSEVGSRFAERLLTVVASCRQQGRSLLEFLVTAGEAALRGSSPPCLLSAPQGS